MRQSVLAGALVAATLLAATTAACSDDDGETGGAPASTATTATTTAGSESSATAPTTAAATSASTSASVAPTDSGSGSAAEDVVAGEPFPEERCAANQAAGTITYLSGFDFAATASIIDVVVAEQAGYFDDVCLDVELQSSFSTANYPIVASGDAQFASGGSFSELVRYAGANEAELVAAAVEGRTAIDSLILRPGTAQSLADLEGATIGVKGALPPSVAAMLATEGLVEGENYETVLLDGFDPLVHIGLDGISAFPGYKSNEPGQLERAGVEFDLFDPTEFDIPGSFGVLFTSAEFLSENPTAAEDFVRATMRGLADALADPEAAAAQAIELVEAGGNPSFLSPEGEAFRWATDVELLTSQTPAGTGVGIPDVALLQEELDAYTEVGLFGDAGAAPAADFVAAGLTEGVYDGAEVIWPG